MTWRQIYEEKRCHYKNEEEKKKGKVIFVSKKRRPEEGTEDTNITDLPPLWSFVVKREGGFLRAFN